MTGGALTAVISAYAIPLASLSEELRYVFVVGGVLTVAMPFLAATYGWSKGYPFFPLLLAGVLIPFFGPGLVFLAVAIAGERPQQR